MAADFGFFYALSHFYYSTAFCVNSWILVVIFTTSFYVVIQCVGPKKQKTERKEKAQNRNIRNNEEKRIYPNNSAVQTANNKSSTASIKLDDCEIPSYLQSKRDVKKEAKMDATQNKSADLTQELTKKKGKTKNFLDQTQNESTQTQLITPTWLIMKPVLPSARDDDADYFKRSIDVDEVFTKRHSVHDGPPSVHHAVGDHVVSAGSKVGIVTTAETPSTRAKPVMSNVSNRSAVTALPELIEDHRQISDWTKKSDKTALKETETTLNSHSLKKKPKLRMSSSSNVKSKLIPISNESSLITSTSREDSSKDQQARVRRVQTKIIKAKKENIVTSNGEGASNKNRWNMENSMVSVNKESPTKALPWRDFNFRSVNDSIMQPNASLLRPVNKMNNVSSGSTVTLTNSIASTTYPQREKLSNKDKKPNRSPVIFKASSSQTTDFGKKGIENKSKFSSEKTQSGLTSSFLGTSATQHTTNKEAEQESSNSSSDNYNLPAVHEKRR